VIFLGFEFFNSHVHYGDQLDIGTYKTALQDFLHLSLFLPNLMAFTDELIKGEVMK